MRKRRHTATIAWLCFAGGALLLWPFTDDRSLWWMKSHLEVIDSQLLGLRELLREYKEVHGRYPTNDEGLATLDNFESRFTITYYPTLEESRRKEQSGFCGYGPNHFWWQGSKKALAKFRDERGRPPRDQMEFSSTSLGSRLYFQEPGPETEQQPTSMEIAIDGNDNIFLMHPAGVLSPWLFPYNYENRDGCPFEAFKDSPVTGDQWGCSVRVDDDVYVYSSGGLIYAREYRGMWVARYIPRYFGGFLILFGAVFAVVEVFRGSEGHPLLGVLAVIPGFLVAGSFSTVNFATCYVMAPVFSRRTSRMVAFQMELLEKYRENGVISEETFSRAVSAVRRESSSEAVETENAPG